MQHDSSRTQSHIRRSGHVTVEMAVILPIALGLFLGAVEFTRINSLLNGASAAAYEGARAGMLPGATVSTIQTATQRVLDANGVRKSTVGVTPAAFSSSDEVTVTVTIPLSENTWGQDKYGKGRSVVKSCTLSRETSLARSQ